MKFSIKREEILPPLQFVAGVVERRHTLPILSNLLLTLDTNGLRLVGSDQEVELVANISELEVLEQGAITVPARKLIDICRSLRADATLECELVGTHLQVKSGRYRSQLGTLPAEDYPSIDIDAAAQPLKIQSDILADMLMKTSFAMAQQDVRYFFNGMLMRLDEGKLITVATNGQRLATTVTELDDSANPEGEYIVPRKGVLELLKAVKADGTEITAFLTNNHLRVISDSGTVTTKLIDATYPQFEAAIPSGIVIS